MLRQCLGSTPLERSAEQGAAETRQTGTPVPGAETAVRRPVGAAPRWLSGCTLTCLPRSAIGCRLPLEGHELGQPARSGKADRATCLLTSLPTAGQPLPEKHPHSRLSVHPGRLCRDPTQEEWRLLDGSLSSVGVWDRNSFAEHLLGSAVNRDTGHVCHVWISVSEKEVNKCSDP